MLRATLRDIIWWLMEVLHAGKSIKIEFEVFEFKLINFFHLNFFGMTFFVFRKDLGFTVIDKISSQDIKIRKYNI